MEMVVVMMLIMVMSFCFVPAPDLDAFYDLI
jgi:hypothetical protein